MGGPSSQELLSDETLTKYIDGEITDQLLFELFERELSKNSMLQERLQNMIEIKIQISNIFGKGQTRPTEFVINEIENIIGSSPDLESPKVHNENLEILAPEVLISSLIDGELVDPELSSVKQLIANNETYQELYNQLLATKRDMSEYIFPKNLKPSNKVKMEIDFLVAGEFEKPLEAADVHMPAAASPPTKNIIKFEKRGVVSAFNYYAQRLVPLAAVFVAGLYISPAFLYTNMAITTRGGGSETVSNAKFDFIEVNQKQNVKKQTVIYFNLTAPIDGESFITLESSSQDDILKIAKGKKSQLLGLFEAGQSIRYPAEQNLCLDKTDKFLRVDIEIRGKDKIVNLTEFVSLNHKLDTVNCSS